MKWYKEIINILISQPKHMMWEDSFEHLEYVIYESQFQTEKILLF